MLKGGEDPKWREQTFSNIPYKIEQNLLYSICGINLELSIAFKTVRGNESDLFLFKINCMKFLGSLQFKSLENFISAFWSKTLQLQEL